MKDFRFIKHPANALHNNQFSLLLAEEGFKGYGIYWAIMENLFGQPGYCSPLKTVGLLATRLGVRKTSLLKIIHNYGLFVVTETHFSAPQLNPLQGTKTPPPAPTPPVADEPDSDKESAATDKDTAATDKDTAQPKDKQETSATHTPDCTDHTPIETPQSDTKQEQSEDNTEILAKYLSCNQLKINKYSDRQDKTLQDYTIPDINQNNNSHTEYRACEKNDFQQSPLSPPVAVDRSTGRGPSAPPCSATATDEAEAAEKARRLVRQLPLQKRWLRNISSSSPQGNLILTHLSCMQEAFLTYLCLMGEEKTIGSLEDAKRRFFLWTRSKAGKEYILGFRKSTRQNDPYAHEQLIDGRRTYLGRPIPDHAPPRPDDLVIWDDKLDKWTR